MSSPSKPVNIRSPLASNSATTTSTPSSTPDIRALRAQYSGTPPVPNIPVRHTLSVESYSNSAHGGSPSINLSSNELFSKLHRSSSGTISAKRPASAVASGSAVENNAVDLDNLPAEDKARILRRHLLMRGERHQSRTDLRSLDGSEQDIPTPDPDDPSAVSLQRDASEPFSIPYHAPGADVT